MRGNQDPRGAMRGGRGGMMYNENRLQGSDDNYSPYEGQQRRKPFTEEQGRGNYRLNNEYGRDQRGQGGGYEEQRQTTYNVEQRQRPRGGRGGAVEIGTGRKDSRGYESDAEWKQERPSERINNRLNGDFYSGPARGGAGGQSFRPEGRGGAGFAQQRYGREAARDNQERSQQRQQAIYNREDQKPNRDQQERDSERNQARSHAPRNRNYDQHQDRSMPRNNRDSKQQDNERETNQASQRQPAKRQHIQKEEEQSRPQEGFYTKQIKQNEVAKGQKQQQQVRENRQESRSGSRSRSNESERKQPRKKRNQKKISKGGKLPNNWIYGLDRTLDMPCFGCHLVNVHEEDQSRSNSTDSRKEGNKRKQVSCRLTIREREMAETLQVWL